MSTSAGVVERQPTHLVRSRPNVTNEELMNCRAPKIVADLSLIASADFAIAQQDRFPQPTSSRLSERNLPPGHSWLEIIKRPTLEAFAAAFTKDVVLEASVLRRPITGAADVRTFFEATRAMYDTIAFKHEVTVESRSYLEWEGTFQGHSVAGMTMFTKDTAGLIESIRLYHRPYDMVIAFSTDLAGRLAGEDNCGPLLRVSVRGHPVTRP